MMQSARSRLVHINPLAVPPSGLSCISCTSLCISNNLYIKLTLCIGARLVPICCDVQFFELFYMRCCTGCPQTVVFVLCPTTAALAHNYSFFTFCCRVCFPSGTALYHSVSSPAWKSLFKLLVAACWCICQESILCTFLHLQKKMEQLCWQMQLPKTSISIRQHVFVVYRCTYCCHAVFDWDTLCCWRPCTQTENFSNCVKSSILETFGCIQIHETTTPNFVFFLQWDGHSMIHAPFVQQHQNGTC